MKIQKGNVVLNVDDDLVREFKDKGFKEVKPKSKKRSTKKQSESTKQQGEGK